MYCSERNFKKWQFLIKLKESQQCWGFFFYNRVLEPKKITQHFKFKFKNLFWEKNVNTILKFKNGILKNEMWRFQ